MKWLVALLACMLVPAAQADIFRPAYLELRETVPDTAGNPAYEILWKVPAQGDMRMSGHVRLPFGTINLTEPQGFFVDTAFVERWRIARPGGLVGQVIGIDDLSRGVSDVIVRLERRDGSSQMEHLLPESPQFTVKAQAGTGAVAWSYLVLGVEHILGGVDHLLFVLGLLLIVRGGKRIFITITAFTAAHSITLAAATLGWVRVPGPPIEAMIALSIVFVAAEIIHGLRRRPGLTARAPWVVAFSFGLLHGLGFAGALAEVGMPEKAIPVALLTFNIGVELGQLIFVTFVLAGRALLARLPFPEPAWMPYMLPYVIGSVAMFWVIERIGAFY